MITRACSGPIVLAPSARPRASFDLRTLGGVRIRGRCSSYSRDLVRRDRHPSARSTDDDGPAVSSRGDLSCDGGTHVRAAISAWVDRLVPRLPADVISIPDIVVSPRPGRQSSNGSTYDNGSRIRPARIQPREAPVTPSITRQEEMRGLGCDSTLDGRTRLNGEPREGPSGRVNGAHAKSSTPLGVVDRGCGSCRSLQDQATEEGERALSARRPIPTIVACSGTCGRSQLRWR